VGGVLGQVAAHLQPGGGVNPVPVNAGPVAAIPNPPILPPRNRLLQQQNLPYIPPNAQQLQHLQNQGLIPPPPAPLPPIAPLPPVPGPLVAAPAQAGIPLSDVELGLEPTFIHDSNSSLNSYHEQFSYFSCEAYNSNYFYFPGAHDLSDSDYEI
jgi:hypothetical protein